MTELHNEEPDPNANSEPAPELRKNHKGEYAITVWLNLPELSLVSVVLALRAVYKLADIPGEFQVRMESKRGRVDQTIYEIAMYRQWAGLAADHTVEIVHKAEEYKKETPGMLDSSAYRLAVQRLLYERLDKVLICEHTNLGHAAVHRDLMVALIKGYGFERAARNEVMGIPPSLVSRNAPVGPDIEPEGHHKHLTTTTLLMQASSYRLTKLQDRYEEYRKALEQRLLLVVTSTGLHGVEATSVVAALLDDMLEK